MSEIRSLLSSWVHANFQAFDQKKAEKRKTILGRLSTVQTACTVCTDRMPCVRVWVCASFVQDVKKKRTTFCTDRAGPSVTSAYDAT